MCLKAKFHILYCIVVKQNIENIVCSDLMITLDIVICLAGMNTAPGQPSSQTINYGLLMSQSQHLQGIHLPALLRVSWPGSLCVDLVIS